MVPLHKVWESFKTWYCEKELLINFHIITRNYCLNKTSLIFCCSISFVRQYTYTIINIERVSKHSVTIRGLRMVITCSSWAWSNRTSPSKWVGLGWPPAACSVYGNLTCSVHPVNNLCMFNCQCHFYFVIEDHTLDWHSCQICYPLEIKIL